jgi:hypothetical protein
MPSINGNIPVLIPGCAYDGTYIVEKVEENGHWQRCHYKNMWKDCGDELNVVFWFCAYCQPGTFYKSVNVQVFQSLYTKSETVECDICPSGKYTSRSGQS